MSAMSLYYSKYNVYFTYSSVEVITNLVTSFSTHMLSSNDYFLCIVRPFCIILGTVKQKMFLPLASIPAIPDSSRLQWFNEQRPVLLLANSVTCRRVVMYNDSSYFIWISFVIGSGCLRGREFLPEFFPENPYGTTAEPNSKIQTSYHQIIVIIVSL
jgi:hypothetical protein